MNKIIIWRLCCPLLPLSSS